MEEIIMKKKNMKCNYHSINPIQLRDRPIVLLYDKGLKKEYVLNLPKRKEGFKLSLISDAMFQAMFNNDKRIKYPAKLFSFLFTIPFEELVTNLRLRKENMNKKHENDYGGRRDFVAEFESTLLNIEMNNNDRVETMHRNNAYLFDLYLSKLESGKKNQNFSKSIQININNFAFVGNDDVIEANYLRNEKGEVLTDKIMIINIYLPNLRAIWYDNIRELTPLERYLLLLIEPSIELSRKLAKGDVIMEEYVEDAIRASGKEYLRESYDREWALKDQGQREGIEIGQQRGIEIGQQQAAKSLLQQGILSTKDISDALNMPLEEVEKLR